MRPLSQLVTLAAFATGLSATATRANAQSTATAVTCKDSTRAVSGLGACSNHGGVMPTAANKKMGHMIAKTPPPPVHKTPVPSGPGTVTPTAAETHPIKKTPPPESTASAHGAIAKCKDGTLSFAKTHADACSGHLGVADWLDGKQTP